MDQTSKVMEKQKLGIIVCQKCEKEIETFYSDQVITQYGICSECKKIKNK